MTLKAGALRKGDKVGLLTPSSPISPFPRRTERGLAYLRSAGLVPVFGKYSLLADDTAPDAPEKKAADLHGFLTDKSIKAILCTTGGWSANTMLPHIDFSLVRKNPKIICGFSDITALLLAVYKMTGLACFYGPTLLPSFGEHGGAFRYTERWFKKILFAGAAPAGPEKFTASSVTTHENLFWDRDDWRRKKTVKAVPWKWEAAGRCRGRLIVANLSTLERLVGTPYLPDFTECILALEDTEWGLARFVSQMAHLAQLGILERIRGLVLARHSITDAEADSSFSAYLGALGSQYGIPVLRNVDFGHTEPRLTLPIGCMAQLDSEEKVFSLLEKAVVY